MSQAELSPLAPNRYYDRHFDTEAVKIGPGEYYVTQRDIVIVTVLGSCVSVCLRDVHQGIGGMNHFMLPGVSDDGLGPVSASARYGVYAMELLVNRLLRLGAQRANLEAKVFGGGSVMAGIHSYHIGQRNAEFALDYLANEQIPIVAQDLLEVCPRKVYFFPRSGRVMLKRLRALHNATLLERETEYRLRIRKLAVSGAIELFEE